MLSATEMQQLGFQQEGLGFSAFEIMMGPFFDQVIKNPAMINGRFLTTYGWRSNDPVMMLIMKAIRPGIFTPDVLDQKKGRCRMPEGLTWEQEWSWEEPDDCPTLIRANWCHGDVPERVFEWFKLDAQGFFKMMTPSGKTAAGYMYNIVDSKFDFGSERTSTFVLTGGFQAIQRLMAAENPYAKLTELKQSPSAMGNFLTQFQVATPRLNREREFAW